VTPRALSLNLKQMIDVRLVARDVTAGYPPSTRYSLAEPGKILFASLSA
jgi:DNA-binding HxlR family transcriptional regulator